MKTIIDLKYDLKNIEAITVYRKNKRLCQACCLYAENNDPQNNTNETWKEKMASPTITVSIEIRNPSSNETTKISKGPYTVSQSSLPTNLLQSLIGIIGALILGLSANQKATCITPILLLGEMHV